MIEHVPLPDVSVPVKLSPVLALTVALPVGLPGATVKLNLTARPTVDGFRLLAVIAVVVAAWLTTNCTVTVTVA